MFDEFNKQVIISNKELDLSMNKLNAVLECSIFECALELENLEFLLLTESTDDVSLYIKEAKETMNSKVNMIIKSTIVIIEKFFSDLINKVKALFIKKEIEDSIEKLKIKSKDPEIANAKIDIPDFNGETRVIGDYKNNLKKIYIEINALANKVAKTKDTNDLEDLNKQWSDVKEKLSDEKDIYIKKYNDIKDKTVNISVGNAIRILTQTYNSSSMDVSLGKMKNSNIKDISGIDNIDTMDIKIMKHCLNMQVEISKIEGNLLVNSLTRLITAIFKGIDNYREND